MIGLNGGNQLVAMPELSVSHLTLNLVPPLEEFCSSVILTWHSALRPRTSNSCVDHTLSLRT